MLNRLLDSVEYSLVSHPQLECQEFLLLLLLLQLQFLLLLLLLQKLLLLVHQGLLHKHQYRLVELHFPLLHLLFVVRIQVTRLLLIVLLH